ncbi:hypothetical protein CLOSTHATH_05937 [Hungatella hathewayi DSM 13479]|uniref:Uncharacterized protein n=1 Tax=Hungatella hathewayi DSM 13479 TaxID=566550 RepID=D3AQN0_9FIRM|nr:hypothetical protein CLOSTHATH_05937 [Hungatella hathewayi DSM 13479]
MIINRCPPFAKTGFHSYRRSALPPKGLLTSQEPFPVTPKSVSQSLRHASFF